MKRFLSLSLSAVLILLCALMAACSTTPSTNPTDTDSHQTTPNQTPPSDKNDPDEDDNNNNNDNEETTDSVSDVPTPPAGSDCNHTYGDWMTTKEPSCTEAGSQVRICSTCSNAEIGEISALGHTTEAGICDRCGESFGEDPAETIRNVIEIYDVYVVDVNSAGGVEIGAAFTNTSNKTIKYIRFYVVPYNAVGDQMFCEIQDHSRFEAYVTGPLEPGHEGYSRYGATTSAGYYWENCWWNSEISYIELTGVKIEYTDGTEFSLNSDTVKLAMTDYPIINHVTQTGVGTGFSRNYDEEQSGFDFHLTLLNRHSVSLKRQAKVDVRMVNTDGKVVFEQTYRIDENDYVESEDKYMGTVYTASFTVYDSEIEATTENTGQLYYRVYSDDGEFSFDEESEFTTDLPETETVNDTWLSTEGQSYDGYAITVFSSDNSIFLIEKVTYDFNTTTANRLVGTVHCLKLTGPDSYSSPLRIQLFDPNGNVVLTSDLKPAAYEAGDTAKAYFYVEDFVEGEYLLRFTDRLSDGNGLYYNMSTDLQSFAAYLSADTVSDLIIPDQYAGTPVTALRTDYTGSPNLTSVTIPATVTSIDNGVFADCDNLTSVTVDAANPIYHSAGNCIIETATGTLIAGCNGSSIPADSGVTTIIYEAFANCHGLTSITIPEGVEAIQFSAFGNCTGLQSITLPASLTQLDPFVFENCSSLKEITIPAGITFLSYCLFVDCTSLETVTLLGDVTEIQTACFSGCQKLKNFTIPSSTVSILNSAFDGCDALLEAENGLLYVGTWLVGVENGTFDAVVRDGTTHIACGALYGASTIKTLVVPDSVVSMNHYAFEACYQLRTVTLGSGITTLEPGLFADCRSLTDVTYNGTLDQWNAIEKEAGWMEGTLIIHTTDGSQTYTYNP